MTVEKAIEILSDAGDINRCCAEDAEALDMAIEALEQKAVLDKIIAEIWEEAEWAYSDFDDYKEAVLGAEPDELPDDEFRFGLHRAVEIINKYKKTPTGAEGENQ